MTDFLVVGETKEGAIAPFLQPAIVNKPRVGDIVKQDGEFYRIYEDGRRGLRFWSVTTKWHEACKKNRRYDVRFMRRG